jgi:CoA:oxalate CoA-transferase
VGTSVGDITAGLFTAIGINAALVERARTGLGRKVDVAMLDCQIAILENAIARYFSTGQVPGPLGARHPSITPFEAFQTADGWMIIAAGNDQLFRKLAEALSRPDLAANELFATNELRTRHAGALKAEIEQALSAHGTAHWLSVIDAAGVPCGPINDVAQALSDPQIVARNMVVSVDDPDVGRLNMAGNPIKLSDVADPQTRRAAPALDADRERILRELGL